MAQQKELIVKIKKIRFIKKIIFLTFLAIIIFNVAITVWGLREKYSASNYWQNFPSLEKTFLNSQYVNKHPEGWIPDEAAFSYAGGKLIKGTNPVLVVPDAPPLGKYIIGLSTIIFNNDSTFILTSAILSLFLLYFLSLQVLKDNFLALLPPFFLSFEPIFKNQLIYAPLMDIFQLVFLLCIFIFFNKGLVNKKSSLFFLLTNVFLGFFIATKFFVTGFVIATSYYIVLFLHREKRKIIEITLSLPVALGILLLSYVRVFAFGYTIMKFLGIQKWVFLYHKSFLILPLSIWPLLLLNKWYVWFGDTPIISDPQWAFTWPILTVISIATIMLYVFNKIPKNKQIEILMTWFAIYMLFLSFGEAFSRYFVIMIPILYIISIYGISNIGNKYLKIR